MTETGAGAQPGRSWVLDYETGNCTIEAALRVVGEKWTFLVLREAFNGVRRFADIQRRTGMPRQVLSDRLRRLPGEGILRPGEYREAGQRPRQEYRLTRKGVALFPVIVSLLEWGNAYAVSPEGPLVELRHDGCAAAVGLTLTCAEGHTLESAREVRPVPGPGARAIA
jgi:DNA-binding HxlR family transcriptional regulator